MTPVMIRPNTPARQTAGNISTVLPRRSATVKPAKPSAAPSAVRSPNRPPADSPSATMIATPRAAPIIATHVERRTCSPRRIRPRTAAMNGAELARNSAFATVVWVNEKMKVMKLPAMHSPAMTPVKPTARKVAIIAPRLRAARKTSNVTTTAPER